MRKRFSSVSEMTRAILGDTDPEFCDDLDARIEFKRSHTVLEQLSKRVADRVSGEFGVTIPWDQIIELILQLIEQCMENRKTFLSTAKAPTFVQKAALNIAIRRTLGVTNRRQVLAVQSAVLTTAAEATDEELGQCHCEACDVLGINYDHDPGG